MKAIKGIFAPKYLLFSLFGAANFILGNLLFLILWYRFNSNFSYVQIAFPTTIFMFIISYLVQTRVTWKNKVYSKSHMYYSLVIQVVLLLLGSYVVFEIEKVLKVEFIWAQSIWVGITTLVTWHIFNR